jgi:hypothetical protein
MSCCHCKSENIAYACRMVKCADCGADTLHSCRCPQLREEVERLKQAQHWIPVEERLPETRDPVLTLWVSGMQSVKQYDEQHGWNTGAQVTHWMPLPEPPEALP